MHRTFKPCSVYSFPSRLPKSRPALDDLKSLENAEEDGSYTSLFQNYGRLISFLSGIFSLADGSKRPRNAVIHSMP